MANLRLEAFIDLNVIEANQRPRPFHVYQAGGALPFAARTTFFAAATCRAKIPHCHREKQGAGLWDTVAAWLLLTSLLSP